jgi:hypothetical protein
MAEFGVKVDELKSRDRKVGGIDFIAAAPDSGVERILAVAPGGCGLIPKVILAMVVEKIELPHQKVDRILPSVASFSAGTHPLTAAVAKSL